MNWMFIIIPLIAAFIGWLAIRIVIKMLFHPREPKKIAGITFQGIFPKKQHELTIKLGRLISTELFSFSEIEQKISNPANVEKILPLLETHIDTFLREKLVTEIPMLGMLIGDKTILQVKGIFMKELKELFPVLMQQYISTLKDDIDLEKIVIEKVGKFSSDKLQHFLNEDIVKYLRFAELFGALLGFIIGLMQVAVTIVAM